MDLLRTPDERFDDLDGFDFDPTYSEVGDGIRVHHVDTGEGPTILLMHGEPTWSYLYRSMIGPLVRAGHRVVAPDLVGFGRSDKPTAPSDHTYEGHVAWMLEWLDGVDLDGITLFCQDWGGLIGLRMLAAQPDRFARLAVANTFLPTGDRPMPEAFTRWQRYAASTPNFVPGAIVQGASMRMLSVEEMSAYGAPFPGDEYLVGPRTMPSIVPSTPDDPSAEPNRQAWEVLAGWDRPCLTLFSDGDPITAGGDRFFQKIMPGAADQPHQTITDAGHFLQEDAPDRLSRALIDWMA